MRAATAIMVSVLSACSDEQPTAARNNTTDEKRAAGEPNHADDWLELAEGISPPDWLAARSAAHGKNLKQVDRDALEKALATAAVRLGESPRMIANRSVQLEAMLHDLGHQQDAIDLIEKLTSAIGETGQTEGFGAISQHYYIMRKSGLTAEQALEDLKRRYGPRG